MNISQTGSCLPSFYPSQSGFKSPSFYLSEEEIKGIVNGTRIDVIRDEKISNPFETFQIEGIPCYTAYIVAWEQLPSKEGDVHKPVYIHSIERCTCENCKNSGCQGSIIVCDRWKGWCN